MKPPRSAGQLQRIVREFAHNRGTAERRVRDWISYMALGGCLEAAAKVPRAQREFSLKGGVVMELRLRGAARATVDLDLTWHGNEGDSVSAIERVIASPYGRFSFRRSGEPHQMTLVNAVRMELAVRFDGQQWGTIVVDVGRAEIPGADIELVPAFDLEADFGIAGPTHLPCISARYHLAHKIHGMTRERPGGATNERVQDAVDALLLREVVGELPPLRAACVEVFAVRNQHSWPPRFVPPPEWAGRFAAMAGELKMNVRDLETATAVLQELIDRIDAAVE